MVPHSNRNRESSFLAVLLVSGPLAAQPARRLLFVVVPGSTSQVEYQGVGILVFDIDAGHKFLKRIPTWPVPAGQQPENVRGVAANARTGRLYVGTVKRLAAFDLANGKIVWEKTYDGRCCDRIALSPDGATIYAPSFGTPKWYVIDAERGDLVTTISVPGYPRQTLFSRDGAHAFLAAWESSVLTVVETKTHKPIRETGPFSSFVCPFTIDGKASRAFANVDGLVGFEVADLQTGLVLDRVVIEGYQMERRGGNSNAPATASPLRRTNANCGWPTASTTAFTCSMRRPIRPFPSTTIEVRAQPRWITFGIDGRFAYPSTGTLSTPDRRRSWPRSQDERGVFVHSETMIEMAVTAGRSIEQIHPRELARFGKRDVLQRALGHAAVGLDGVAADVRRQDDIRQRAQIAAAFRRNVRLAREHVERGTGNAAARPAPRTARLRRRPRRARC